MMTFTMSRVAMIAIRQKLLESKATSELLDRIGRIPPDTPILEDHDKADVE